MKPSTSKGDEKNVFENRQRKREKTQVDHADFIEYMILKNLELWEGLRNEFIAMRRFGDSSRDHQSDETPSSLEKRRVDRNEDHQSDETPSGLKKRRVDRNEDNADKEPLPTKRRKGGSSVSETSKEFNDYEKGTATNKSRVAHNKKGITPQDRHAAHKEKYRGGNSESEMKPNKDTRLMKKDKTSKGSSSTLDISPTIGKTNQKEQKELANHMKDIWKSHKVLYANLLYGIGEPRKVGDVQEFGEKLITSVNKVTGIACEMKKQKIQPTGKFQAYITEIFYAYILINDHLPSDPLLQQMKPKLRELRSLTWTHCYD